VTVHDSADDVGAFLSVFAALLLDNVLHLDDVSGRVTNLVMNAGRPDRDLIVALQAFDRLKQEFEALGDALTRYAKSINAAPLVGEERAQLGRDVVLKITIADLKDRLLRGLDGNLPTIAAPHISEDIAPEVDVDVVF
jgi:hypothetical protein